MSLKEFFLLCLYDWVFFTFVAINLYVMVCFIVSLLEKKKEN